VLEFRVFGVMRGRLKMENVLLVGEDAALLEARAAMLERSGVFVAWCRAADLDLHLWNETYDLVILCHTLTSGVARSLIVAEIYRRWPHARILHVIGNCEREAGDSAIDASLVVGDLGERGELIEVSMELLGKSRGDKWRPVSGLSHLPLAS
jgi:hypothetical protein